MKQLSFSHTVSKDEYIKVLSSILPNESTTFTLHLILSFVSDSYYLFLLLHGEPTFHGRYVVKMLLTHPRRTNRVVCKTTFLRFFSKKSQTCVFTFFELLHTFSRTLHYRYVARFVCDRWDLFLASVSPDSSRRKLARSAARWLLDLVKVRLLWVTYIYNFISPTCGSTT